ncbi:MAG: hypothetical protein R3192_02720 [Woeseiaceae bacterium]|nr:hypothetical protein [Woeseiaceae bacterium]
MRIQCLTAAFFCLSINCVAAEPDLSGIWVLDGRASERELVMTDNALAIQAEYDLLNDDPSLECEPASLSRVWANPNSRFLIRQESAEVLISYELFDLRRVVPLGDARSVHDTPSTRNVSGQYFKKMGSSLGRYAGDRLIIETHRHSPGFIRTSRGIPQSENTTAIEEFWLDGDTLYMQLTYEDETLFERPFVIDHRFKRVDEGEILPYNCEGADYDWFEKLNQSNDGEAR